MIGLAGHPFSLSMSILLAGVPLLDRAAVARQLGYQSVESWWPWDEEVAAPGDINRFADSFKSAGVQLLLLNVCAGDARYGRRGLAGVPDADRAFWRNWDSALEVASRTGARHLNVLAGDRQGSGAGGTPQLDRLTDRLTDRLADRLAVLADQAHEVGVGVVIEQLNRFDHPNYLLTEPEVAVTVCRKARSTSRHGNVGLLADVYHLARSGTDTTAFMAQYAGLVRHVQIADAPGRGRPGSGAIPIRATLKALADAGYDGMVGLEYSPADDELAALARPDDLWQSLHEPESQGEEST